MERRTERAWLLYRQGRHDAALDIARLCLADDPHDVEAMSLMALCHGAKKEFDSAERIARGAVAEDPQYAFAHYVLADVMSDRHATAEALSSIERAIEIDPNVATYRAFRGSMLLALDRREDALVSAEEGLQIDPTNAQCLNIRAQALLRLGRTAEARSTLETALSEDPEDPHAHAAQGWAALQSRNYDQALFHFSEALRRNPNLEWARAGLVEAMKAKNVLYRPLLAYFVFMSRLTSGQRWMVVLGIYFAPRVFNAIGREFPTIAPFALVLGYACIALALLSWIGVPIANFLLATNRFGRAALLPVERAVAYVVGTSVCLALVLIGISFVEVRCVWFAGALFVVALASSGIADCDPGYPRVIAIGLASVLGAAALGGAVATLIPEYSDRGGALVMWSLIGAMFSGWLVNILMSLKPRR